MQYGNDHERAMQRLPDGTNKTIYHIISFESQRAADVDLHGLAAENLHLFRLPACDND